MDQLSIIKRVLISLLDGEKNLFFFHEKFSIFPGELFSTIKKLSSDGLVYEVDNVISITSQGKKFLFINKKDIYFKNKKDWLIIPNQMNNQILKEDGYLLSIKKKRG